MSAVPERIGILMGRQGGFSSLNLPAPLEVNPEPAAGFVLYLDAEENVKLLNGGEFGGEAWTGQVEAGATGPSGFPSIRCVNTGVSEIGFAAVDDELYDDSAFTLETYASAELPGSSATENSRVSFLSRYDESTPIGVAQRRAAVIMMQAQGPSARKLFVWYYHIGGAFPDDEETYYYYAEQTVSGGDFHHAALTWDGSQFRGFVNGQLLTPAGWVSDPSGISGGVFLRESSGMEMRLSPPHLTRWDQSRFTPGEALYTSNFTPPTEPFYNRPGA